MDFSVLRSSLMRLMAKHKLEMSLEFFDGGAYNSDKASRAAGADLLFVIAASDFEGNGREKNKTTNLGKGVYLEIKSFIDASARKSQGAFHAYMVTVTKQEHGILEEYMVTCERIDRSRMRVTNTRDYINYATYENCLENAGIGLTEALGVAQKLPGDGIQTDYSAKYGEIIL